MTKQNVFKWFKRFTFVAAIIPILIFLAFAGAVSLIDFNQYKPQIEQEVSELTGRDFDISGDVSVSIVPFMFTVEGLSLKNPKGFVSDNLLTVEQVQVELSLASLFLDKEISVISLELTKPSLFLVKTAQGNNWSDIKGLLGFMNLGSTSLVQTQGVPIPLSIQPTASEWFAELELVQVNRLEDKPVLTVNDRIDSKKSNGLKEDGIQWAFESIVVNQGKIEFQDVAVGYTASLSDIDMLTFDVVTGEPFDVSLDFIYQHSLAQRTYNFHLNSALDIQEGFQKWTLTDWKGVFKFRLPAEQNIPDIRLTTEGEALTIDLAEQTLSVVKGQLLGLEGRLTSSFAGQFGAKSVMKGEVEVHHLNFKNWAYHLGLPLPDFVNHAAPTIGNGTFEWQWDGQNLRLEQISAQMDGAKAN